MRAAWQVACGTGQRTIADTDFTVRPSQVFDIEILLHNCHGCNPYVAGLFFWVAVRPIRF